MRIKPIDRRSVMRGLAKGVVATLGLPVLDVMLNTHGTAFADGTPPPLRYGTWFWGVGAYKDHWLPTTTGAGWTPSPGLSPLASVRDYVSIVSNTRHPYVPVVHYSGQAYLLTGYYSAQGNDQTRGEFGAPGGPSIDQMVAKAWKGKTRLDSVTVGVSEVFQGGAILPPTQASWLDKNKPNYHEFSLTNFYNTLFSSKDSNLHTALQQKSILDAVSGDMAALQKRLGSSDQQRLAAHAQCIRDLEVKLTQYNAQCVNAAPVTDLPIVANHEPLQERSRLFADMITVALSCDITRVFTVQFTGRENDTVFWQVGATQGCHDLSHVGSAASIKTLNDVQTFNMGELSYLLQKLKATPEGAGNLLDSCAIYGTSCIGNPTAHSYDGDLMLLLAGKAGGALTSGIHYSATTEMSSSVALTALHAVGVGVPSFGSDGMASTQPLKALMK